MNRLLGLLLLVIGGALLYYGWQAHESVASTASNAVTGAPTSKAIWLLAGGAIVALAGLGALFRRNS